MDWILSDFAKMAEIIGMFAIVFSLIFVVFPGFKLESEKMNFEIRNHKFSGEKQVYLLFVWT